MNSVNLTKNCFLVFILADSEGELSVYVEGEILITERNYYVSNNGSGTKKFKPLSFTFKLLIY